VEGSTPALRPALPHSLGRRPRHQPRHRRPGRARASRTRPAAAAEEAAAQSPSRVAPRHTRSVRPFLDDSFRSELTDDDSFLPSNSGTRLVLRCLLPLLRACSASFRSPSRSSPVTRSSTSGALDRTRSVLTFLHPTLAHLLTPLRSSGVASGHQIIPARHLQRDDGRALYFGPAQQERDFRARRR
jgi:hypothetical protein